MALANKILPTLAVFAIASSAFAEGILEVDVYNNELRAEIEFVSGVAADVTISFEQASGLDATSIGLDAEIIDPLDPAILARLPGTLVTPTSAFPLLLSIEPPGQGTLSFLGLASVSLHTHNLPYTVGTPLRLFVSDDGGPFVDITERTSSGSYRVRGSQGEFCEFMIVADLRPIDQVIATKFDRLSGVLDTDQSLLSSSLYTNLAGRIGAARSAYDADDHAAAIDELDDFMAEVRNNAGGPVPNLWRSRDDLVNLDGRLRSAALTLRYSLTLLANDLH